MELFTTWKLNLLQELKQREKNARQTANSALPAGEYRKHCNHAAEMYRAAYEAAESVEMDI